MSSGTGTQTHAYLILYGPVTDIPLCATTAILGTQQLCEAQQ